MRRRILSMAVMLVAACQAPIPMVTGGSHVLHGRVSFPGKLAIQADAAALAAEATVSLLRAADRQLVAVGQTTVLGSFQLNVDITAGLADGDTFYLVVTKRPGPNQSRIGLETVVRWHAAGSAWHSITGTTHVVNASTTAVCRLAEFAGLTLADIARADGAVDSSDGGTTYTQMDPAGSFTGALAVTAAALTGTVTGMITADLDPVSDLRHITEATVAGGTTVTPGVSTVTVKGYGFDATAANNVFELAVGTRRERLAAVTAVTAANQPTTLTLVVPGWPLDTATGAPTMTLRALGPGGGASNTVNLKANPAVIIADGAARLPVWQTGDPNPNPQQPLALTVEADGTAHLLWVDQRATTTLPGPSLWHRTWHPTSGLAPAASVQVSAEGGTPLTAAVFDALGAAPSPRLTALTNPGGQAEVHALWSQALQRDQAGTSLTGNRAIAHRIRHADGTWSQVNHASPHAGAAGVAYEQPALVADTTRPAIVYVQTNGNRDLFYHRWAGALRGNGAPEWAGAPLNLTSHAGTTVQAGNPAIAVGGGPSFRTHVVWESVDSAALETTKLLYRRLAPDGTTLDAPVTLAVGLADGTSQFRHPQVAADAGGNGDVLVVWQDIGLGRMRSAFLANAGLGAAPVPALTDVPASRDGTALASEAGPSLVAGASGDFFLASYLPVATTAVDPAHGIGMEIVLRRFTAGAWLAGMTNVSGSAAIPSEAPALSWNGVLQLGWLEGRRPAYMALHLGP